jgi:hypothetical protein
MPIDSVYSQIKISPLCWTTTLENEKGYIIPVRSLSGKLSLRKLIVFNSKTSGNGSCEGLHYCNGLYGGSIEYFPISDILNYNLFNRNNFDFTEKTSGELIVILKNIL